MMCHLIPKFLVGHELENHTVIGIEVKKLGIERKSEIILELCLSRAVVRENIFPEHFSGASLKVLHNFADDGFSIDIITTEGNEMVNW